MPAATPVTVRPYGAAVDVPSSAPLAKNSTLLTEPSLSAADAARESDAGAIAVAPSDGDVIETVGGTFGGGGGGLAVEIVTLSNVAVALVPVTWLDMPRPISTLSGMVNVSLATSAQFTPSADS